ncbi:hypothetical protein [Alteromonas antoniana]|uniref:hypothetical protein n=1 Tax=Alteromonas antoniana TaxID=2803813 RepID=UPI001C47219A|nr:hypothetical protein [Alteromonas antoniana]
MKEEANNVFSDALMRGSLFNPNTKTGSLSYLFFNFSCARQLVRWPGIFPFHWHRKRFTVIKDYRAAISEFVFGQ